MVKTIQISEALHKELTRQKLHDSETYEDVIWDLLEDHKELNEETRRQIAKARKEAKAGNVVTLSEAKRRLGL